VREDVAHRRGRRGRQLWAVPDDVGSVPGQPGSDDRQRPPQPAVVAQAQVSADGRDERTLVLGDLGILGSGASGPVNLTFWRNLAGYALRR